MKTTYQAEQNPIIKAEVEAKLDEIIPDSAQKAPTSSTESTFAEAGNVQTEAQSTQEAAAQTEQKARKKKQSKKEAKHEEMLDQLDVAATERKAAEAAEKAEAEQQNIQEAAQQTETLAQSQQKAAQQAQSTAEIRNAPKAESAAETAQSGAQREADRKTMKRAYEAYGSTDIDKASFDKLYNEAYNAESFEAFLEGHPEISGKLKSIMQKAFKNGQSAGTKAKTSAQLKDGLIIQEGDEFLLTSRKSTDELIARYKEEADNGRYWAEADDGSAVLLRLEDSEIEARRNAIEKLTKYRDEHFGTEQKAVSTEKKSEKAAKQPLSTEQKLEKTVENLEKYKKLLENGNMEKLKHQNPDRYGEIMYRLERMLGDEHDSDYLGDADDVSVLIDKYKGKLEMLKAETNTRKGQVDSKQKFEYNRSNQYATAAPYYNTEVTAENKQQIKETVNKVFTDKAKETAEMLGIKLKGDTGNIGGFTFPEGEAAGQQVHEISYTFEFEDATPEQAQLFASLMAENGYEQQEAVIQKQYVNNIDDGNAFEYTIRYRNIDEFAVAKALEKVGITDYTIDTTNRVIQILEFDTENNTDIRNKIDVLLGNNEGDNFYGTDYNPIKSEYLDETSRAGLYRSWLETGEQDGRRSNYISEALRKVEERIAENERIKNKAETKADAESTGYFNAENSAAKTQQDEYSAEYQKGAEHPETVGAMESDRQNITRAANENGTLPAKENPFSDFDRYKADNDVPDSEKAALSSKIKDPVLGEITVAQNITNLARDGATFIEQNGKYYAQNKDGSSAAISEAAYNYGKWLNKNGVHYTFNQNEEVPKKINGRRVSKAVTTFIASRGGTDAVVKAVEAKIESEAEGFTYTKKSHAHDAEAAGSIIVNRGFDGAVEYFLEQALGDHKYTSEINTLGIMLKNIAAEANAQTGDTGAKNLAIEIMAAIAANQTNSGQVTESMKIDRQLIENNSEIYYQQLVQNLEEKYKKRLKGKEITLDPELLKKVAETAGTKEGLKWQDRLNTSIANQIPATVLEKINAYRYFCMLSSGRTHAKNILSNAVQYTMVIQKNLWLSLFERMYKAKHSDYMLTTSGLKTGKAERKFAKEAAKRADMGGGKYESKESFVRANRTNTLRGNGTLSKYNLPGWVLDRLSNTTTNLLSGEDAIAKRALFKNRMAQIMTANGWTAEFLSDTTSPEAIRAYEKAESIAIEEALKGTFNDESSMVQLLTQWKNLDTNTTAGRAAKAAAGAFIELNFPFKNVPFNIAGSAVKYSPVGLVMGINDLKGVKNGSVDARVALENVSKGMTGTTVTAGGILLGMLGLLTLGKGRDEDKPIEEKEDTTMYLKIPDEKDGDLYIEIDWIDSVAMQLRTGLELKNLFVDRIKAAKSGEEAEEETAEFWGTFAALTMRSVDTFMDIGMMSTLSNLLLNKSGARSFEDVLTNQVTNLATQFIPRIVTDIRQAFDKEKRNTYYKDKTADSTSEYPKYLQWILSAVPETARNQYIAAFGDRERLPARIDEWGNSLGEENDAKRAIESLIAPGKWYREKDDEVLEMLDQLDSKVDGNVFPGDYPKYITVGGEKINLSGKEYEQVAREIGTERYKILKELMNDKGFKKLSSEEKADVINTAYKVADQMAKVGFDDKYAADNIVAAVKEARKEKIPTSTYLLAAQAYGDMSAYEKDGATISKNEQLADYLTSNKSTTAEEDVIIFKLLTRTKKDGAYTTPLDRIEKIDNISAEETLKLYTIIADANNKEKDIQTYMLEGYSAGQALARYNAASGAKTDYEKLGKTDRAIADKILEASEKGKTEFSWDKDRVTLGLCALTSIGSYGTLKTESGIIEMLTAVGFSEKEAQEFYKYYK